MWQRYLNSRWKHTVRDSGQSEHHFRSHWSIFDTTISAVFRAVRSDRSRLARLVLAVHAHNLFTGMYLYTRKAAFGIRSNRRDWLEWSLRRRRRSASMSQTVVRSPPRRRLVHRVATATCHSRVLGGHYGLRVSQISRCKHPVVRRFIEAPVATEKRFALDASRKRTAASESTNDSWEFNVAALHWRKSIVISIT